VGAFWPLIALALGKGSRKPFPGSEERDPPGSILAATWGISFDQNSAAQAVFLPFQSGFCYPRYFLGRQSEGASGL